MLTELNDILQEAERQRAASLARAFGMPPSKISTEISAEFKSVLTGIAKPASVPPRSAPALQQSIAKTFQPNADAGLQVVNAFRPDLNAALSVAVANTKVTPESAVKVFAPRLKTGVYANSAPLKPVYDQDGRVSSYEEWPLTGAKTLQVELLHHTSTIRGWVSVTIILRQSGSAYRTILTDESRTGQVDLLKAQMTIPPDAGDSRLDIELTNDAGEKYRTVSYAETSDESIRVTISTPQREFSRSIVQGQTQRFANLSDRIEMDLREKTISRDLLKIISVIDEVLLPPDPQNVIALDAQYDQVAPDSWVVIQRSDESTPRLGRVARAEIAAKTDYNFPARVTQLTLEEGQDWLKETDLLLSDIRGTTVYAQSEELALVDEVIEMPICSGTDDLIELDGLYRDLQAGRWLIISGERTDIEDANQQIVGGIKSSELVMLDAVVHTVAVVPGDGQSLDEGDHGDAGSSALPGDKKHTYIRLAKKLEYCYKRNAVTIYGNVVKATHGETRHETLGSGDGSKALQSFTMRQPPLTYVAASAPAGTESTLQIYVNDLQWHESDALAGRQANDRLFITRTDDEGKTSVTFGNGRQGARLPAGMDNVKAVYRNGIGKPGNVQAEQISLLMTRPLGVRGVTNPIRASGGADKENRDSARRNAPLAVTALDRLVSVQDYADFARTFAGIGKAAAHRLSDSQRELVYVTIAGADDIPIDQSSDLYRNLLQALRRFGDPYQPIQLAVRELLLLVIGAGIHIQPDYLWEPVVTQVRNRLLDVFSFERRELAQDVLLSEVIRVIQEVEGVAYVDVCFFGGIPERKADDDPLHARRLLTPNEIIDTIQQLLHGADDKPRQRIVVNPAGVDKDPLSPAQLAFLTPNVPGTLILNQIS